MMDPVTMYVAGKVANKTVRRVYRHVRRLVTLILIACMVGVGLFLYTRFVDDTPTFMDYPSPRLPWSQTTTTGTVHVVLDGDTLDIDQGGQTIRVRLLGIDAPEISHDGAPADCGGDAAHTWLRDQLPQGTTVQIETDLFSDPEDTYGRTLAYISTSTIPDVNQAAITAGMVAAWIPHGEPQPVRFTTYTAAQTRAQTTSTGSWAICDSLGR